MLTEVLHRLRSGATVLTPTRRLARFLKAEFDRRESGGGRRAWASADILTWNAWVDRWIVDHPVAADAAPVLSQPQEDALWHAIIGEADNAPGAGLARLAAQAWSLQWAWRIPVAGSAVLGEDARAYLRWSREFETRCKRMGWVSRARAPDHVAGAFARGVRPGRSEVVLYAFDALAPQQTALLHAFEAAGGRIHQMSPMSEALSGMRFRAGSTEGEFQEIAWRAIKILQGRPAARIGVVVPDLAGARSLISRVFDEALEPARVLDSDESPSAFYNFSLGAALTGQPVVRALLLALALPSEGLSLADLGDLLLSPYLMGGHHELGARAQFDAELRRRGALHWTLESVRQASMANDPRHVARPSLDRLLHNLRALDFSGKRRPSQWCDVFKQTLDALGWPGERPLGSTEFQVVAAAREILEKLNLMDVVVGTIPCSQARGMLARLYAGEVFQPETPAAPIQVMGVLESAGIQFDHLFITGMHADVWPAPYQMNPLLPVAAQRARDLPHSSPDWELRFSTRMMRAWSASAEELVYSHAAEVEGEPRRSSMLILPLPEREAAPASPPFSYAGLMLHAREWESAPHETQVPWPATRQIRGGVSVLSDQAACPFRAFAAHRLGARALERGRFGLDARERGTLLHEALRNLYTRNALEVLLDRANVETRNAAIRRAVSSAIDDMARRRPDVLTDGFRPIEAQRIAGLLRNLLDLESQRSPFRVVACESPRDMQVSGLSLGGRLDRIDALIGEPVEGRKILVDYKTGEANVSGWFGPRPDQPQMPLYAISEPHTPRALVLVQLNADEVKYTGLSSEVDALPGVLPRVEAKLAGEPVESWEALMAYWRRTLDRLAQDFLAGHHAVDPKNGANTCRHCDLPLICRIAPMAARPLADPDDDVD